MSASSLNTQVKTNHVEVYLEISDFEDITHAQITDLLGVKPSRIYIKGQPFNPNFGSVALRNRWLLYAYEAAEPRPVFENQFDALLTLVMPRMAAFQDLCHRYTSVVGCAVKIYFGNGESTPSVHLERRHVEMLEALTAEFDVDIYCRQAKD